MMIKRYVGLGFVLAVLVGVILLCVGACSGNTISGEPVENITIIFAPVSTETTEILREPISPLEPVSSQELISVSEETVSHNLKWEDPTNDIYPYSMVSEDWGADVYEQGWKYYEIPNSYKMAGGMFPEVAQIYLWCICQEAGVDYYMALALIERESGYRYDATGDSGNSKGLMQIQERWHKDRMEDLGAEDLYNPYDNMLVGVNFLKEIQDIYLDNSGAHCVLMAYNMGAFGANKLWVDGIYSTAYTRQILQRAQEIKQELQDQ